MDITNNPNVEKIVNVSFLREMIKTSSLPELLGILLILICCIIFIIFILSSIEREKKDTMKDSMKDSMRILGSLLVISLTLISDNGINYFLSIVILATLVTETEFLEKIVTSILGSDKFSIRNQKNDERTEKLDAEDKEIEKAIKEDIAIEMKESSENIVFGLDVLQNKNADSLLESETTTKEEFFERALSERKISDLTPVQFSIIVHDLTFNFLERRYGKEINRYVIISDKAFEKIDFDGIIEDKKKLELIEIKSSINGYVPLSIINKTLSKNIEAINILSNTIKREIEFKLVLVGKYDLLQFDRIKKIAKDLNEDIKFKISIEIFTFEEIGMDEQMGISKDI